MKEFGGKMYRPGKVLAEYSKPASIRWEGTPFAKKHRQQFFDHQQSAHYTAEVGCIECHSPHGSQYDHNLKAAKDDNALCLGCHGETPRFQDASALVEHTRHAAYLERKGEMECISCHQQQSTFSASMGDGPSHHFEVVSPAVSLAMFDRFKDAEPLTDFCTDERIGHASLTFCYSQKIITNSCSGCHDDWKGTREGFEAGVKAFNEMFY